MDEFIVNHAGPGVLLRNDGGNRNFWLKVALEGRQSNRSAIGARLRLVVAIQYFLPVASLRSGVGAAARPSPV